MKISIYSNGTQEDREAERLLKEAGIECLHFGPTSEDPTPFVKFGDWKYVGLAEIRDFVKKWKENRLPEPFPGRTEERAREFLKKYLQEMISKIKNGGSGEIRMTCPSCDAAHSIGPETNWRCHWIDCKYVLPRELVPVGPAEIKKYLAELAYEKWRKEKFAFMRSLFPEGEFDKLLD